MQAACCQGADIAAGKQVQLRWLDHQRSVAVAALSLRIPAPAAQLGHDFLVRATCSISSQQNEQYVDH